MTGILYFEVISMLDLKDAYHTLTTLIESRQYCSIITYTESQDYVHNILPVELQISPALQNDVVQRKLSNISGRKHFILINKFFPVLSNVE